MNSRDNNSASVDFWKSLGIGFIVGVALVCVYLVGVGNLRFLPNYLINGSIDELSWVWIFERWMHNFQSDTLSLFYGGILFPNHERSLLFSESMPLSAVIYAGFKLLTGKELFAVNLTYLLFMALNYAAMYGLCRTFVGKWPAMFGALFFAFGLNRVSRVGHLHLMPQFMLPLIAYWLKCYINDKKVGHLLWAAIAYVIQFYLSISLGIFTGIALIPAAVWVVFANRKNPKRLAGSFGAFAVAVACIAPMVWFYSQVSHQQEFERSLDDARMYSAHITNYLLVPDDHPYAPVHATRWTQRGLFNQHEKYIFIGYLGLLLALLGVGVVRRNMRDNGNVRRMWVLGLVTGVWVVWLSLGPQATLYSWVYAVLPGFKAVRTPARLSLIYLFLVSLLITHGTGALLGKKSHRWTLTIIFVGLMWFGFENRRPLKFVKLPDRLDAFSEFMARDSGRGPILHIPVKSDEGDALRMYKAISHGHPIANGQSGFYPAEHQRYREIDEAIDSEPNAISQICATGIKFLAIEWNQLPGNRQLAWRKYLKEQHLAAIYSDPAIEVLPICHGS